MVTGNIKINMNGTALNKVLIIDDDSKNVFALSVTLRVKGYNVVTASSARQALQLLNGDAAISIILSDIMMPDIDGFDLIKMIRDQQQFKDIPVIAVTAQAMAEDRERCIQAGASAYISKPVDVDILLSLLHKYKIAGSENNGK